MTFLPIVERELRLSARRPATHWTRFFAVLAALALWLLLALSTPQWVPVPQLSKNLFIAIGLLSFGFFTLAGVFLTADCVSMEKREGTLGLLFLTDLKSHDVVFGKLVATSVHSLCGLLAIFPVMALPLLLGGVTGAEFGRVLSVLLVTLFLSLALGLFVSTNSRESRNAVGGTFLFLLLLAVDHVGPDRDHDGGSEDDRERHVSGPCAGTAAKPAGGRRAPLNGQGRPMLPAPEDADARLAGSHGEALRRDRREAR